MCTICNQHKHELEAPPYWRSGGAVLHLEMLLEEIWQAIDRLVVIHAETEKRYGEYLQNHPEMAEDDELPHDFFVGLMEAEDPVKFKADLISLMSAIEAEDELNRFCVFNLSGDMAESIERLSPPEKLLIASAALRKTSVKSTAVYEGVKKLNNWRNAFAHGHCVDRTTKSLRDNHLIHPSEFPGLPKYLENMHNMVGAYLRLSDYLRKISRNKYTKLRSNNVERVRWNLAQLARFEFDGDIVYEIRVLNVATH